MRLREERCPNCGSKMVVYWNLMRGIVGRCPACGEKYYFCVSAPNCTSTQSNTSLWLSLREDEER
jgi:hypothetical protein